MSELDKVTFRCPSCKDKVSAFHPESAEDIHLGCEECDRQMAPIDY